MLVTSYSKGWLRVRVAVPEEDLIAQVAPAPTTATTSDPVSVSTGPAPSMSTVTKQRATYSRKDERVDIGFKSPEPSNV